MKRKNPYQRLLEEIKDWSHKARFRHRVLMFSFTKGSLKTGWSLQEIYERTQAADHLGYDVVLVADTDGLKFFYKKKLPSVPLEWD